ncbi:hypothetical protein SORBI_3K024100 [Sorghum bicolor]|uniref:Uncharacterized protein n=1 Tax=Sorghum bicolor TaxID=4558 RepID=A0A125QUF5_SORBI|nr:hypothetical protein SORBI_3K024100 [Sorghum bicolor]
MVSVRNGHLVPQEVLVEDVPDRPREHLLIKVAESKLAVVHHPRRRPVLDHILKPVLFPSPSPLLPPRAVTITHLPPHFCSLWSRPTR